MYSLRLKLYISQRTENQRDVGFVSGFVYSLHSFFVSPFIYVYSNAGEPRRNPTFSFLALVFLKVVFLHFSSSYDSVVRKYQFLIFDLFPLPCETSKGLLARLLLFLPCVDRNEVAFASIWYKEPSPK